MNTGGPAFPQSNDQVVADLPLNACRGMTLRDYFAAKAMQEILSDGTEYHQKYEFIDLAYFSYQCADAMLKAREA